MATFGPLAHLHERRPSFRPAVVYVALAWGLSWAWLLPLLLQHDTVEPGRGWPTHLPALVGPALAAVLTSAWFGGRSAVRRLGSSATRVRVAPRWWLVALSPLLIAVVTLAVAALSGRSLPALRDFGVFTGTPSGLLVLIALLVNGFGEETGWRGFLLPTLERRLSPITATVVVAIVWGVWHVPMFWVLSSFEGFGVGTVVAWWLGLLCGAVLLSWLYQASGGSIAIVAVWHAAYNLTSATRASDGLLQAVETTVVMLAAVVIAISATRRSAGIGQHPGSGVRAPATPSRHRPASG